MGTTPIYGLRYQELGDAPHGPDLGANLAADVETELTRIDAAAASESARLDADIAAITAQLAADPTTTTLTPTHADFSGTVKVREIVAGVVAVVVDLDVDALQGALVDTGCVIPAGLRPLTAQLYVASQSYNSTEQFRYRFDSDGKVWFQHTGSDNTVEAIQTVWFTA